jgi:hypothetical protein
MYLSPVTSYIFRCLLHHLQTDHYVTFTPRQRNNITTEVPLKVSTPLRTQTQLDTLNTYIANIHNK